MSHEIAVPPAGGEITRRPAAGAVAVPHADVPVYRPGPLEFVDAISPEEAWGLISAPVRTRVNQRAGRVVEWWAWTSDDGRPHALVLGEEALVSATPTITAQGRPAHVVECVRLRRDSARTVTIHEDTLGRSRRVRAPNGAEGRPAAAVPLPDDMQAFLGNLPDRAQRLLQEPFLAQGELHSGYHYYLTAASSGFGPKNLKVICFLHDHRWLTCLAGKAVTYSDGFDQARWELVCRRIAVRPR